MLYLTGASLSRTKGEAPQTDTSKSLGGFASTTPVPNSSLNSLFDGITDNMSEFEVIALALINETGVEVRDVSVDIELPENRQCDFQISAVKLNRGLGMESIQNRYQEPMMGEFMPLGEECVLLTDTLGDGEGVGIWIKRVLKKDRHHITDEELIEMYKSGESLPDVEEAVLVVSYN